MSTKFILHYLKNGFNGWTQNNCKKPKIKITEIKINRGTYNYK